MPAQRSLDAPMNHATNASVPAPFLVIKGYHMGSAWFEEAFNQLRGGSFFFEYEHCLRDLAPAGGHLAPATTTAAHLQQSCGRCDAKMRVTRCLACGRVPPPEGAKPHHFEQEAAASGQLCLATGISFGAVGPVYLQHLTELRRLMPRLPVLVHVRSNLVKHALSYLRQSCPGEVNHATKQKKRVPLHVPPARLLVRLKGIAHAQDQVLAAASQLAPGVTLYRIVYEAMQADLDAELRRVLRAVGAPPPAPPAPAAPTAGGTMVKAGFDDLRAAVANFDRLDATLRGVPCLHGMLHATEPRVFPIEECAAVSLTLVARKGATKGVTGGAVDASLAAEVLRVERLGRNTNTTAASPGGGAKRTKKELSPRNCAGLSDPERDEIE